MYSVYIDQYVNVFQQCYSFISNNGPSFFWEEGGRNVYHLVPSERKVCLLILIINYLPHIDRQEMAFECTRCTIFQGT